MLNQHADSNQTNENFAGLVYQDTFIFNVFDPKLENWIGGSLGAMSFDQTYYVLHENKKTGFFHVEWISPERDEKGQMRMTVMSGIIQAAKLRLSSLGTRSFESDITGTEALNLMLSKLYVSREAAATPTGTVSFQANDMAMTDERLNFTYENFFSALAEIETEKAT